MAQNLTKLVNLILISLLLLLTLLISSCSFISRTNRALLLIGSKFGCPTINRYSLTQIGQSLKILSPNYPLQYPLNTSCSYHISSPVGTKLLMSCMIDLPHTIFKCPRTGDQFQYSLTGDEDFQDSFKLCGHYHLKTFTSSNQLSIGFTSGPPTIWSYIPTRRSFKCKIKAMINLKGSSSTITCGGSFNGKSIKSTANYNTTITMDSKIERIIGGIPATRRQFPWRCALQIIKQGVVTRTCTCSIISNYWILSSVHCTLNEATQDVFIRVGTVNFNDRSTSPPPLPVSVIQRHSSYNPTGQNDDISVLKLSQPLVYNQNVAPICLPCKYRGQQFLQEQMTVSGWVENPSGMQALLYQNVQVMNRQMCSTFVPINMDEFCTFEPGKTQCLEMGDSGSFADYRDPQTGIYYAAGIFSWNKVCMAQNMPAVHQNVARFLDWIETNTGEKFC